MGWHFWIDRGGTFTDIVSRDPHGLISTAKLLSEAPECYDDAAVEGMRRLMNVADGPLPPATIRIGTTVATNALLERKGSSVVLAISRGFKDALAIGYQDRPDIFARRIDRVAPLYDRVIEIEERVSAIGEILTPLDQVAARLNLQRAYDDGLRAIAIVLMHGYRFTDHETCLAAMADAIGFTQISVSHQVAPLIKLIARGETSVVDAYLTPVVAGYVAALSTSLGPGPAPLFMQSSGGLIEGSRLAGRDAVLSGPAGGIVGMAKTGAALGIDRLIGFDMGGTSTDVSHYAGRYERDTETLVAGVRVLAPMMRIHTVAAGGGSICFHENGRYRVGPQSAGALPGPASYRRGGPLTVTDCNLILGKIQAKFFPALFGPNGDQPIDRDAAVARAKEIGPDPETIADGMIAIAVANMAHAIKRISVARGHDVRTYTLACFGGAGGQHACLVADALGMQRIMIHPHAGVLSAYGLGLADRTVLKERTVSIPLDGHHEETLRTAIDDLAADARTGFDPDEMVLRAHLRFARSDSLIDVPYGTADDMGEAFRTVYRKRFGFLADDALICDMLSVEAITRSNLGETPIPISDLSEAHPKAVIDAYFGGHQCRVPLFDRTDLPIGWALNGPAVVVDAVSTTIIEPAWRLRVDKGGSLLLDRIAPHSVPKTGDTTRDPVRLEIFSGLFMAIAEEMGAALQHSASSVNIRERLDFSCALFDAKGQLVANAPHIPVHLGSMGESIQSIIERRGRTMRAGEAYALNDPYHGGTHLPDITVIMPVFVDRAQPSFYVAARGHHADIGGISPGSMPPNSTCIQDEGIILDNVTLVTGERFQEAAVRMLLGEGAYPARAIDQNIADLQAQVAACARGASELRRISGEYGVEVIEAYMEHVQAHAEEAVRGLVGRLKDGRFAYEMDDGAIIRVAISIDIAAHGATVDFTGTSDQRLTNFNAPRSITHAAVLYAFRTLLDEPIPMNAGCLRPITIVVPAGSMLDPLPPAAVVAGNVETSQAVTDAIFGALGALAGSQGTMNNFTFGNAHLQYYETIAGGSGAGPDFEGTSAVQTHMTNSRLTDPEVLETRFPVLVDEFAVRRGSGGEGLFRGGDGAIRRIQARERLDAGILANRRRVPPFGLKGGCPGKTGRNWIERVDGRIEPLPATAVVELAPGDRFVIETPGGGGFGTKPN